MRNIREIVNEIERIDSWDQEPTMRQIWELLRELSYVVKSNQTRVSNAESDLDLLEED